jgi:hypothetical protein
MVSTTTFLPYTSTLFSPRPFFLQDPSSFPLKKKQRTYGAVCLSVFRGPRFYCLSLRIFISFEVWGGERGLSLLCFCRYDIVLSHQWVCDCVFRVFLFSCYRQSSLQNLEDPEYACCWWTTLCFFFSFGVETDSIHLVAESAGENSSCQILHSSWGLREA